LQQQVLRTIFTDDFEGRVAMGYVKNVIIILMVIHYFKK